MRLYQKKQCLETITLLGEAHGEIAGLIKEKKFGNAQKLLEKCQQSAICMGTLVETAEGEGTRVVRYLEEYCELVYQLYVELSSGALVDVAQLKKKLQKQLIKTVDSLIQDITTEQEAVFLPYKASMWDSLESVWRAAAEDPCCTALVIPIPYYDRNLDGSFGEMHYEADLFPDSVPVIPYNAYDFEACHPDIIFIHNPYDDKNYVTSVSPFFYSENLKKYTDELVYIPYFVQDEIDPFDEAAVQAMEHFCTAPGVVNADHVVVQSEAMRQVYVNVLTKYTGEYLRSYWEKKVLGLGSPKFDRVRGLRGEDFPIPDYWKTLIQKEAGGRKKVIFYNTTVSAILQSGEAMLDKIERVLCMFREESGEVVLLWRPHPLMEATLASMRPHLLERYRRIVEEYKAAGWGIYDDSADLDRAIAVSDGYYGDMSSVVWLYRETGKPVMIQIAEY